MLVRTKMSLSTRWAAVLMLGATTPALAQPAWHAPGWSHRAVVKVGVAGSGSDTAAVRILHAGTARDDGRDYRLFDGAGRPVPYAITYHAPGRDTLISFRAAVPGGTFGVYFGKADAPPDAMRALVDPQPGAGPPQPGPAAGGWIPRAGLVLTTMRRPPEIDNPKTVDAMAALITQSPRIDGAAYRRNIRDGVNPFGDSDHFISVYRGWIRLPKAGTYGFCTASNEASFSFLDGKELVHWPGRHTEQRGKYGQKDTEVKVASGLHYVEYYHEEMLLYQVAFLGYRPPGGPHFVGIPDSLFPQPHPANVVRYEREGRRPTVLPRVELVDSIWPRHRPSGQYTRYRFAAEAGAEAADLKGWAFHWQFGDGQEASGRTADHVYLATGGHDVRLTATAPDGATVERHWPLVVFPIEHLAEGFKEGKRSDYTPMVSRYDRSKLGDATIAELVRFFDETGMRTEATATARDLLGRADAAAANRLDAHLVIAGVGDSRNAWHATPAPNAADHLLAALRLAKTPARTLRVMARLIRHVGVDKADVEAAETRYAEAETLVKQHTLSGQVKRAFREATIAVGDAHLAAGRHDQASQDYRLAEALAEPVLPLQVRVTKIGAYPERLTQLIKAGKPAEAQAVTAEWYDQMPSDLLRGEALFWIGKVEGLRGRHKGAIRPLRLAIELGQGAAFEAEARWLLAEAHRHGGDRQGQRAALISLIRGGFQGAWRDKADAALKRLPKP